jgi:hypothetical protein
MCKQILTTVRVDCDWHSTAIPVPFAKSVLFAGLDVEICYPNLQLTVCSRYWVI